MGPPSALSLAVLSLCRLSPAEPPSTPWQRDSWETSEDSGRPSASRSSQEWTVYESPAPRNRPNDPGFEVYEDERTTPMPPASGGSSNGLPRLGGPPLPHNDPGFEIYESPIQPSSSGNFGNPIFAAPSLPPQPPLWEQPLDEGAIYQRRLGRQRPPPSDEQF